MSTPILSEKDLKKTLSKKKLKKATIKNVLATPYSFYWPLLKTEDASSLSALLNERLMRIKHIKVSIPWSKLKDVPREERKKVRLEYIKSNIEGQEIFNKSEIAFGINETTKLLENNIASSILISGEVNPKVMVKHIIDLAVLKKAPVLITPNLKNILKEKAGIESVAIAFKKVSMDSQYWSIDQKIKEISANYPVPPDHINFHRNEDNSDEDITRPSSPMDVDKDDFKKRSLRNVYLHRKSKTERVFVPELSQNHEVIKSFNKIEVDSSGFLAFSDDPISKRSEDDRRKSDSVGKSKVSYKSLIIKRVTNNKNRDKKKIEMLKKSK